MHAILAFSIAFCLFRRELLKLNALVAVIFAASLVILLGEVKVIVIWIPVAIVLIFGIQLFKSPKVLILTLLISISSFLLIGKVYEELYWKGAPQKGLSENATHSVDYFFDTQGINYKTGEVSRGASLNLWVADKETTIVERAIGYGIGASSSTQTISDGEVARKYSPLNIGATTAAIILWDGGVLSLVLYTAIFIAGIFLSLSVERKNMFNNEVAAYARASRIGLVLLFMTIGYNSVLITDPSSQLFLAWIFGFLCFFNKSNIVSNAK
jgi:hypothetical protein